MRLFNFISSSFQKYQIAYIDSRELLMESVIDVKKNNSIAIDTEFIWKNTYYPILSLIQIATRSKIYLLDFFSLKKDLDLISEILEDDNIMKVFHSARGDLSILSNSCGLHISSVFDTQLAESLFSINNNLQISYKSIVYKYFMKKLLKTETNSDWGKRPLSIDQILYAADDVRYLLKIMTIQKQKINKLNLIDKYEERIQEEICYGRKKFKDTRLERFLRKNKNISDFDKRIFIWREEEASSKNIPPNKIFKDKNLKKLKEIIKSKNLRECDWIIQDFSSRKKFLEDFS